jgi:uncharacterized protein with NAD-binding domain and iron-sulfur cluster
VGLSTKKRIVVLGGGASSLAAVYGLTHDPNWQQHFDITVYTLGWRLGGKGATGRDLSKGGRIHEHGLHLWFGFYENAFRMMRQVYAELARPVGSPVRTWEDAFKPHNEFTMEQQFNGQWYAWNLPLPVNPSTPGDGEPFPPPWDIVIDGLQVLYDIWAAWQPLPVPSNLGGVLGPVFQTLGHVVLPHLMPAHALLAMARGIARAAYRVSQLTGGAGHPVLCKLIRLALDAMRLALGNKIHTDLGAYRTWIGADAVGTLLIGMLKDELLEKGFDKINHYNFKHWVRLHGASQETLDSCLVQSAYDSSFAFFRRADNPDFEAGTVLRGALRMFLMYKGSVVYRFAAGTGDSVFAPLYELLKRRGVKFRFFHEVEKLGADEVHLKRQADLVGPEYQPLIDVKGLPCWPMEPLYAQLMQGAQIQAGHYNLESHWSGWAGAGHTVLKKGADYDHVICGLSFEPLKTVAKDLANAHAPLLSMLDQLKTTRTQAFQLWLKPTLAQLGWATGAPLLSTFGEPLDTWADLSLTLPFEVWNDPKTVGYFCGAMTEGSDDIPPKSDTGFPAVQDAQAKADALDFINARLKALWPNFKWGDLVDSSGASGAARFDSQFWRANIDPSERYVLSVTDTSRFRLRADRTGIPDLSLVGDYASCGINAGSMEASIISGLQAARALCGWPHDIPGEGTGLI